MFTTAPVFIIFLSPDPYLVTRATQTSDNYTTHLEEGVGNHHMLIWWLAYAYCNFPSRTDTMQVQFSTFNNIQQVKMTFTTKIIHEYLLR